MKDLLTIDDNAKRDIPDGHRRFKASDLAVHAPPAAAGSDASGQTEPFPERDFDAKSGAPGTEQSEDFRVEKGPVHAEIEVGGPFHGLFDLTEEFAQEGNGCLAVVDVSGSILYAQDLAGFGEVGGDRIVALDLAMVGVEAPERALDLLARRNYRAIDIDGECAKRFSPKDLCDDLGVERLETFDRSQREVFQPATDGPFSWQATQPTEALEESIAPQELDVAQPSSTDQDQSDQQTNHSHGSVVAAKRDALEVMTDQIVETNRTQVPDEKFKAGVGTEPRFGKLDAKIVLDGGAQRGFSISHRKWPFVLGNKLAVTPTSSHSGGPFCNYKLCYTTIF